MNTTQSHQASPVEFAAAADATHDAPSMPEATSDANSSQEGRHSLERFYGVALQVTVELGRQQLSLGQLMGIRPGSVIELEKHVSEPVTVIAQGVPFADGEIVVVNEQFAVRLTQIHSDNSIASC